MHEVACDMFPVVVVVALICSAPRERGCESKKDVVRCTSLSVYVLHVG